MKRIIGFLAFLMTISTFSFAQGKKGIVTENIEVEGVCGQCKKRIENAAYIPGVKRAEWDKQTKNLKVTYNSKKTSLEKIETSISNAGHGAGEIEANEDAYHKLPSCCAYKEVDTH